MSRFCHETVTGSTNEMSASSGPILVIAPLSAGGRPRAKPPFVISLVTLISICYDSTAAS